jgi:oligoribonuclease
MLKRAFSIFSRNATKNSKNVISQAVKVTASEIIQKAQEKVKDPKYDAQKPIVWIDCEMTGLDHENDSIIEICCLITDKNLKLIDDIGYESVIHQDKKIMDNMNEWCVLHHGQSGLTDKVIKSKKTKEQVENELLEYLQKYMNKGVGILAGNSVHMDRLFMLKDMPKVVNYLTYRIIDVSSIMETAKRFHPLIANSRPKKKAAHTAREDILESIQDLEYYRGVYFKDTTEANVTTINTFLTSWNKEETKKGEEPPLKKRKV